ncbi:MULTISPECIES: IclR family transcriptional regulator [Haloarcula]|uniref:IclR family transcriptional regulator n=1 Tax=Haloarcula TaxID=2237 RepID=UPI0023EBDB3B|nr:helix-turn-helix domain-containing protein [Halomicroarcula sp. XH51]
MDYEANRRVETSARTFALVEHLSGVGQAGVSELASELEMSKGIVHNHLSTLREEGYVRKIDGRYQLSPKLLDVGFEARSNSPLYRYATEVCREFAGHLDVGIALFEQANRSCTIVEAHRVPEQVAVEVGSSLPFYDSLVGLVIHAVDGAERDEDGEPSTYDVDQIKTDLDADGYTVGPLAGENLTESVAVPIVTEDGVCYGSVGVLLPDDREAERKQRVAEGVVSLRNRIESRFDSGWTGERSFTTEKHTWVG